MQDKEFGCLICNSPYTEEHHVFGASNRKWSERYGLKVYLCHRHHNEPPEGVHFNKQFDTWLKKAAQEMFEDAYPDKDFQKIFGRNYK